MNKVTALFALLTVSINGFAQRIVIDNVAIEGDSITLTYSIFGKSSSEEKYDIEVLSSNDNYNQPLSIKLGSVSDLSPGSGLNVVIDGPANFDGFQGELDFQIRGRLTFMPLAFIGPAKVSAKRGKTISSSWDGIISSQTYSLQLMRNGVLQTTLNSNVTENSPNWTVPSDHEVGGGYQLKMISNSNRSQSASSSEFSIKRKVPTFVKILPILGAGAAAYLFVFQGGSGSNLPGPPDLPETDQN